MKTIPLTKGQVALVDDADYDWLNQWNWFATHSRYTPYAAHNIPVAKGKQNTEKMHRLILELLPSDKRQVDHIDGNGLNNQRTNLRICTNAQNQQSSRKRIDCTSKYKGVHWCCHNRKWYSRIHVNAKRIFLGSFDSETEAARTYNRAALKYFGEFALLNTF